ncbi:hypothetical protein JY452_04525 [Stenotrophomonas maltophilia]|uniref:hypothetical protein n=1 Tax=Stenotrophomonas TaxID=40323 RepID=UPI00122F1E15|nr:hypothetical protein [Stenotrophomonas sp. Sm3147]MBN5125273.1 hypothetical protein [Stenotrophomonas maltophilia]MBN5175643.1 hypothetical protein [Stenotrophomonas maltophilia]MCU1120992.1 hypothetical protein [Stenotrophomonas maltophilia]MDQ7277714.1 hypothetical protein [Stenotrophomonas sp. Sm3147]
MKMQQKQEFEGDSLISELWKLEKTSLFHLSKALGVPVDQLLVAANGAAPIGLLLPGPVAVHVDGVCFFTPTDLGKRLGLSPQKFNRLLADRGLQAKQDGQWCPTEAGKPFAVLLQVHKKQLAGTDVQQLKWKENVLAVLED